MSPLDRFTEETPTGIGGDRRSRKRYALDLPIQCKVVSHGLTGDAGTGQALDISSSGVAFTTDRTYPLGTRMELCLSWPVLLNADCPLKVVAEGRVIRSDATLTAIRTSRCEFRTRRRRAADSQDIPSRAAASY